MDGRFDLVTVDLDGTLLPGTTAFEVVLGAAGRGEEVAASEARYFAGTQTLEETFWQQWEWVQALSPADLHRALRKAPWLPGIAEGVQALKNAGLRVCLLTDQPSSITDFLARWDLTHAICSPVTVKEGAQVAIDASFDKLANLRGRLQEWRIQEARVCHVGNGANDVPVWGAVGAGIAVFAKPAVAAHATQDLGSPPSFVAVADAALSLHGRGGK